MFRGDIYLLKLNKSLGSVQAGIRPVLIVQNNKGNINSPSTIVCSITSANKKPLPTHVFISKSGGLKKNSTVLTEQVFTVDKKQLTKHLGTITDKLTLIRLNECLKISLGLKGE